MAGRFRNLNKIEFPITYKCTSNCMHCSVADKRTRPEHIDGKAAARAVKSLSEGYNIKTVLTFGGEPLLYPEDVFLIHSAARDAGIEDRVIITNGCFSGSSEVIAETAKNLIESGCNRILVSVDAFHQKNIPPEPVMTFTAYVMSLAPKAVSLQPAWIEGPQGNNEYDCETRAIIAKFWTAGLGADINGGNIVYPEGNAKKYLSEFFEPGKIYVNPYEEDPEDIKTVSVEPDGSLFDGNICREDIIEILKRNN